MCRKKHFDLCVFYKNVLSVVPKNTNIVIVKQIIIKILNFWKKHIFNLVFTLGNGLKIKLHIFKSSEIPQHIIYIAQNIKNHKLKCNYGNLCPKNPQ